MQIEVLHGVVWVYEIRRGWYWILKPFLDIATAQKYVKDNS